MPFAAILIIILKADQNCLTAKQRTWDQVKSIISIKKIIPFAIQIPKLKLSDLCIKDLIS